MAALGTLTLLDKKYGIFDHKLSNFMDDIVEWLFGEEDVPNIHIGETDPYGEGAPPDKTYSDPSTGSGESYNKGNIGQSTDEAIRNYNREYANIFWFNPFYELMNAFGYWDGTPYSLGGGGPFNIDCTHLVNKLYRFLGYYYPHKSTGNFSTLVSEGYLIKVEGGWRKGDILLWQASKKNVGYQGHLAIYIGGDLMIESQRATSGFSGVRTGSISQRTALYNTSDYRPGATLEVYRYKYVDWQYSVRRAVYGY